MDILSQILSAYGIDEKFKFKEIISGLINKTWLVEVNKNKFIVQYVNQNVFKKPYDIDSNLALLKKYLIENNIQTNIPFPINTIKGDGVVKIKSDHYRMLPYVNNSVSYLKVKNKELAYEAAKQFGVFTSLFDKFDASQLKFTIPNFHNLTLRFKQFEESIKQGNQKKVKAQQQLIKDTLMFKDYVNIFEDIKKDKNFKIRVTHHDTKISNVLFDKKDKGLCVIDLDTVMPGFFISDVGDMMRTYLSPYNEEEKIFSKIKVRKDVFEAIKKGYFLKMKNVLSAEEKQIFFYSGQFIIFMQLLRFLTDYFLDDIYYKTTYKEHNLNRSYNQLALLRSYNSMV